MKKVTLTFVCDKSNDVAHKFYTWLVDGGLEDEIIDTLSDDELNVEMIDIDNDALDVAFLIKAKIPE